MLRLCSESSRSYTPQRGTKKSPGRPARLPVRAFDSARHGNMPCDRAGVSRGHSRREETSPAKCKKSGKTYPAEGPNTEKGRATMSSHDMKNPYGGVPMRRVIEPFNPNENLLERILSNENVAMAWKRVKANHGAPGVDGISIEQFSDHTRPLWAGIRESLLAGRYQPPVKRIAIPKATGGTRPLGIPTVLDQLIQQAIVQVLSPIFDPTFSDSSPDGQPMMRFTRLASISVQAAALPSMSTCRSSSTQLTMMF